MRWRCGISRETLSGFRSLLHTFLPENCQLLSNANAIAILIIAATRFPLPALHPSQLVSACRTTHTFSVELSTRTHKESLVVCARRSKAAAALRNSLAEIEFSPYSLRSLHLNGRGLNPHPLWMLCWRQAAGRPLLEITTCVALVVACQLVSSNFPPTTAGRRMML